MRKRNKTATILLLLLAVSLIFSAAFIVGNAGHACHGQHCAVCAGISVCMQILHNAGLSLLFVLLCQALCARRISAGAYASDKTVPVQTPVSLRVKLSD